MRLQYLLTPVQKLEYCALMARKLRIQYPGVMYHVMDSEGFRERVAVTGGTTYSPMTRTASASWAPWLMLVKRQAGKCMPGA
jgi:hypothetical protein